MTVPRVPVPFGDVLREQAHEVFENLQSRLGFVRIDDSPVILLHKELGLNGEGGRPVVHLHASELVRPVDGGRLCHVHDVLAAVTPGALCDSKGLADLIAQTLRVDGSFSVMEGE